MAAQPATVPVAAATTRNPLAWRHALVSAAAVWVAAFLVLLVFLDSPYAALTYIGPLALGSGVVAVLASRLRVRLPVMVYPLLVLGIATLVNAPVLDLLFF